MKIKNTIDTITRNRKKALAIFLTAGFPDKNKFLDYAKATLDGGADILEIGIPFSDPLADGPVIQKSSTLALKKNFRIKDIFSYIEEIRKYSDIPTILMGYANPINKYGKEKFLIDAANCGAEGLIVPDIPLEEYDFFFPAEKHGLEIILLTTPTSTNERIKAIDNKSEGFLYCVSVTGTTGADKNFDSSTLENLKRTYSLITKNRMMIGFGIGRPEDIHTFYNYSDGFIVGSKIIKSIIEGIEPSGISETVKQFKYACN
ncbi:tryptophan synthase subunit alpha [Melioribacter sp. OK-6-Me]|uniref:tryptophan synthase subunit alpha n=1 Tax=unclassified Melioribacter TaxID=2627329 RepID=UPI003EDB3D9B